MKRLSAAIIFAFVSIWSVSSAQPKHEMRMVWIATVNNIDWVPAGAVEPYRQQEAMIAMLDTFKRLNINAIVLQIRPTADAFYQSHVEPWSHFLTGKQGRAPYPYYDPLAFTIEQAHKRNIDVHVWLNPYRLLNSDNTDILQRNSLFFSRPNMFIKYGTQYFFNPARQETLEHLGKVVADIVSRYRCSPYRRLFLPVSYRRKRISRRCRLQSRPARIQKQSRLATRQRQPCHRRYFVDYKEDKTLCRVWRIAFRCVAQQEPRPERFRYESPEQLRRSICRRRKVDRRGKDRLHRAPTILGDRA